jgi:predicted GNAT family N-acyltransferase
MQLKTITYNSPDYHKMLALRTEVLRKPLGLEYTKTQLKNEKNDTFIVAFENGQIKGCCILTPYEPETMQLRQMAVDAMAQGQNIGAKVMQFAEAEASKKGYNKMVLHARKNAVGFYEKVGYKTIGDEFLEINIPHFHMEKEIYSVLIEERI